METKIKNLEPDAGEEAFLCHCLLSLRELLRGLPKESIVQFDGVLGAPAGQVAICGLFTTSADVSQQLIDVMNKYHGKTERRIDLGEELGDN